MLARPCSIALRSAWLVPLFFAAPVTAATNDPVEGETVATEANEKEGLAAKLVGIVEDSNFTIGGFVKLDSFWANSAVNSTDNTRFATDDTQSTYQSTIQQSRIKLSWDGIATKNGTKVRGYAELDFGSLNDTGSEDVNAQGRVRQLFIELARDNWLIRAGQTWDVFSPLNPSVLNYRGNYWYAGNAGVRRPQIVGKLWTEGENPTSFALSMNANSGGTHGDAGESTGKPLWEARVGQSLDVLGRAVEFGVSAARGVENRGGSEVDVEGTGADLTIEVCEGFSLKGEFNEGANSASFLASPLDVNGTDEIENDGFWVQGELVCSERATVHLHYGRMDNEPDFLTTGDLESNRLYGGNILWRYSPTFTVGLEIDRITSDFFGAEGQAANVIWLSVIGNI